MSWLWPKTAVTWGLREAEDEVEPVYGADVQAEATWDVLTLWALPMAGLLLIVDAPEWGYFGLVGGGMYVYFAGRGVLTRLEMQRRGFRVGASNAVKAAYIFLTLWGVVGLVTIVAATISLSSS